MGRSIDSKQRQKGRDSTVTLYVGTDMFGLVSIAFTLNCVTNNVFRMLVETIMKDS